MGDIPRTRKDLEREIMEHGEGTVFASLDRGALKSFFYLFAARPDSRVKVFHRPITVTKQDLSDLNSMMLEKLRLHHVEAAVTRINIAFDKNELLELGSWDEYENHSFDEPAAIEHLSVVWDLLFRLGDDPLPSRHTVTLRIASEMSPTQMLHMIFSGDFEEIESLETNAAPCMVRVDFINSQLSDEIVELVKKWNAGRRKAVEDKPVLSWMRKQKGSIAPMVHYFLPGCLAVLATVSLGLINRKLSNGMSLTVFGYWAMSAALVIFTGGKIGRKMGAKVFQRLTELVSCPAIRLKE